MATVEAMEIKTSEGRCLMAEEQEAFKRNDESSWAYWRRHMEDLIAYTEGGDE